MSLALLGSAQAGSLACPQVRPDYEPVMVMDCCDDESPVMEVKEEDEVMEVPVKRKYKKRITKE